MFPSPLPQYAAPPIPIKDEWVKLMSQLECIIAHVSSDMTTYHVAFQNVLNCNEPALSHYAFTRVLQLSALHTNNGVLADILANPLSALLDCSDALFLATEVANEEGIGLLLHHCSFAQAYAVLNDMSVASHKNAPLLARAIGQRLAAAAKASTRPAHKI